jgi:hypothetical protein
MHDAIFQHMSRGIMLWGDPLQTPLLMCGPWAPGWP